MNVYFISEDSVKELEKYLVTRPYCEVYKLMTQLASELHPQSKEKEKQSTKGPEETETK